MKFSVIIPVYKAEYTLRRCVDSLINQNRSDAEIILINDGSPDSSGEICKEYAELYNQVKYIEKENGGVSTARNAGLSVATGEYILFVDSDDWVTDDYFETINNALTEYDYDLIQFSQSIADDEQNTEKHIPSFFSVERDEIINRLAEDMWKKRINTPNGKVYKRSIIKDNNIRFLEHIEVGEDRTFNIEYVLNINSFRVIEKSLYVLCLENEDSLSRKKRDDLDEQIYAAEEHLKRLFDTKNLSNEEKDLFLKSMNFDNMRAVYTKAKYLHRNGMPLFKRLKELGKYCDSVNKKDFTYPPDKFCTLISLPVRFKLTPVIDAMGWVLTR